MKGRILEYCYKSILEGLPLIIMVTIMQSAICAMVFNDVEGLLFSLPLFFLSFIKVFWLGILLSLLSFGRRLLRIVYFFISLVIFEGYFYLWYVFHVKMTPNVLTLILQTNVIEASDFMTNYFDVSIIGWMLILALFLFGVYDLCFEIVNLIRRKRFIKFRIKRGVVTIFSILFVLSLSSNAIRLHGHPSIGNRVQALEVAFRSIKPSYMEIGESYGMLAQNAHIIDGIIYANEKASVDSCVFASPHIILMIGESFIKRHSNLYGYHHVTSPILTREFENGNLIVFDDVVSGYIQTNKCLQSIFSVSQIDTSNGLKNMVFFPTLFKNVGYKVNFISNQCVRTSGDNQFDYSMTFFLNPSRINNLCFDYRNSHLYRYDGDMIDKEMCNLISGDKTLDIFHIYGEHTDASQRYPHNIGFDKFKPDSINRKNLSDEMKKRISEYDNAILYNDYVIGKIIDAYSNKDAIMVFISDHGECVYDDNDLHYGRPLKNIESMEYLKTLCEIPMFVWYSDTYKELHPEIIEKLERAKNLPFLSDDICHLLFDLAGIRSIHCDVNKSPINENCNPRHRMIHIENNVYDYEAHRAVIDTIELNTFRN